MFTLQAPRLQHHTVTNITRVSIFTALSGRLQACQLLTLFWTGSWARGSAEKALGWVWQEDQESGWSGVNMNLFCLCHWWRWNLSSGLYYKHILTIISDDRKWHLYYNVSLVFALALASVINYAHKWCHCLEHHLLTTLELSFTIVICL